MASESTFIISGIRTAIGDFGGALAGVAPCDLATAVSKAAIERSGLESGDIDQTVFGNVIHTEPRDMYLSRVAAIGAGVPVGAPALTLNRLCGSGLQAIATASDAIRLGYAGAVLAGGAESMSRAGHLMTQARAGQKMGDMTAIDMMVGALTDPFGNGHMGITAENIAAADGIDREAQDALALQSHQRAAHAIREGYFREQILPIEVKQGRATVLFDTDEHVRPDVSAADLAKLRAAFRKDGSVTAGNASGINDGAAALVLASESVVGARGLKPRARIVATGLGGVPPELMGLGPQPAVEQALGRAGLTVGDLDVIESNEAFAAQACAVSRRLGFPDDKTNPNGGAIALGHPVGASGAIIMVKLLAELERIGGRYGLATMCIGGGQGIAVIVENVRL
ncbi:MULTISPECIES: beta-ketothiolase BktB [unclassified Chelatococcus]|uniref:beta-ketothiolase BktB n=1 Tax=unclassified Chelatococcus TaxID=2638111 RepID=UPI001BCE6D0E|nr:MULTISPECIES: beta-ketothiolase BktB [unclassified Chelatococcus]CAH1660727.1 acetyl-CoA acetyltransferase [Hyphomicrobiales bacterium]MBS7741157.1 beta-ketothiolase BktB [Chelatococcus sp. HY11]MBX3545343.1 beta-ketothiolase BktB [Chelatococcus sp.]MCO5077978.1 beta-ketothiolase BktB [Chelatococcus sp.]CAH1683322.1 acetyl-CoA acetyltransferase [Hyphomicrobiales bacterium]